MSVPHHEDDVEFEYSAVRMRDRRESDHESRRTSEARYAGSRRSPTQVNGIHRRRNKRFSW